MNTFDALGYSEVLTGIGVPEKQAKLQAKALSKVFESNDLATKSDIIELKSSMETKMAEMELRIIKWQIGGIGLVIAAIKLL